VSQQNEDEEDGDNLQFEDEWEDEFEEEEVAGLSVLFSFLCLSFLYAHPSSSFFSWTLIHALCGL